jgi:hypothetical protein
LLRGAALLIILGILMIIYPRLVAWGLGIGLILAGIAVLAPNLDIEAEVVRAPE